VSLVVSSGIAPKAPPIEAHHAPAFGAIPDDERILRSLPISVRCRVARHELSSAVLSLSK